MYIVMLSRISCLVLIFAAFDSSAKNLSAEKKRIIDSKFCPEDKNPKSPEPMPVFFSEKLLMDKLQGEGLVGWVHGSSKRMEYYVFTYRSEDPQDPMAFFKAEEFSLVAYDPKVRDVLTKLRRHDKIRLKGSLIQNRSPLRHIYVDKMAVIEPAKPAEPYIPKTTLNLQNGQVEYLFVKVHTTILDGKALVVEYGDLVLPVFVPEALNHLTADLFRNDKIMVSVRAVKSHRRPLHLYLNGRSASPLVKVDSMRSCHNFSTQLRGSLARFEKSPQINRIVYAVKVRDPNGIVRNFTLFPDVDNRLPNADKRFRELFQAISNKVHAFWGKHKDSSVQDRNHKFNPRLQLAVSGRLVVISKTQANPQIYIKSPDDIRISIP